MKIRPYMRNRFFIKNQRPVNTRALMAYLRSSIVFLFSFLLRLSVGSKPHTAA